jgi:hypothetical protein
MTAERGSSPKQRQPVDARALSTRLSPIGAKYRRAD